MASASVQAAFEGLKDEIARFHQACEGDCDDIVGLFSAMSGQRLPVQALYGIMGISPDFVNQARQSGKPVVATRYAFFSLHEQIVMFIGLELLLSVDCVFDSNYTESNLIRDC